MNKNRCVKISTGLAWIASLALCPMLLFGAPATNAPPAKKAPATKPGRPPASTTEPLMAEPEAWVRWVLAGPAKNLEEVVFTTHTVRSEHWYANIGYYSNKREVPLYGKGGRLCKFNLKTGQLTNLVEDVEGSLRDPCVHYDGRRIVFAWRKGGTENYCLWEINSDGTGLRQLTDSAYDDYEPCWLPDGGIVFVSTRAQRWVNCWLTQVGVIYRCDGNGHNLRPLSANLEHDNTPWVLPDGRIAYMRWEYVDRSQVDYHHLWTMNPDGTAQTIFFGNLRPGGVYLDAKPIPGSEKLVLSHSPGHGQTEHEGYVAVLDPSNGPDDSKRLKNISRLANYRDPWAFDENTFLAARQNQLLWMNGAGEVAPICTLPKEFGANVWLHEPRPLLPHPRETAIPARTVLTKDTGRFLLDNVYFGRNMPGVQRGEIKQLLVLESLPKPINFTGGMDPLSYSGTFTLERVLGTVPVEADGSAYFEAPALRSLIFVALDKEGLAVKRMQSFATVQPGETQGCLGCHEHRTATRAALGAGTPLASHHPPSTIQPFKDVPALPDFPRDIQPILNRHCLKCHDYDKREGGVILSGDHGPMFSQSYYTLTVWNQLADGRNKPKSNYTPHTLGSGGSALLKKIREGHHEVKVTPREELLVRLWLDIGAPYPGTYAALGTGCIGGYEHNNQVLHHDQNWPETKAAQPIFESHCVRCHDPQKHPVARSLSDEIGLSFWRPDLNDPRLKYTRHLAFNLTHPEKSLLLLAPLAREAGGYGLCRPSTNATGETLSSPVFTSTNDPGYRTLLVMCQAGQRKMQEIKRFDMPGFKPRPEYVREMKRYGLLPQTFDLTSDPVDVYALDQAYWSSLWYRPGSL